MSLTLVFKESFPIYIERLARDFTVHEAPDGLARLPGDIASAVDVLITSGSAGATRADIAALPKLGLICTVGTGYEGIDLDACRERGILVTHAAGLNAPVVADHAFGLLIAVVRDIPRADAVARAGGWRAGLTSRPMLGGKHIGIVGCQIALKVSPLIALKFSPLGTRADVPRSPRLSWSGLLGRGDFGVQCAMEDDVVRRGF